ncbi:MAG: multiubiquitin domain-containing protein [Opitutales bacterium]|nr:multiubiquitin domain-containing protein [Opitutales bacterium]
MPNKNLNTKQEANPRWFALVNDQIVIMPRQRVEGSLLRSLSGIADNESIYRDHSSPKDYLVSDPDELNLAKGNVFYSKVSNRQNDHTNCKEPAKLALSVDDKFEIVGLEEFMLETLSQIFEIDEDLSIYRDYESPNDEALSSEEKIQFKDGPVFYTRPLQIEIIVNGQQHLVAKSKITYTEVVSLAFPNPDFARIAYTISYKRGPKQNPQGTMSDGDIVKIKNRMIFNVTPTDKS